VINSSTTKLLPCSCAKSGTLTTAQINSGEAGFFLYCDKYCKMRTINLILFLTAIFPLFANSQTNYKEGYVITDAGDTLKGLIDYREWYYNPDKISFRPATGNSVMDITSATAREVTIAGGETYRRFEVAISMNSLRLEKITDTEHDSAVIKIVFLKQLQKGDPLNLYSYTDKLKMRFYILDKKKSTPEELLLMKRLEDMHERTIYTYLGQLGQYAVQYGVYTTDLGNKIKYTEYNETGLKKIVSSINTSNENTANSGNGKHSGVSYFAGIGIMQAAIKYTGQDFITADRLDANGNKKYKNVTTKNLTPRIAAGINFYSKKWVRRLGVKAELSAYRFASTIVSYTRYNGSIAENQYTFHLQGWSFTVTPQVIYKFFSSHAIKAYVSAGPGFNILTTSKNSMYKLGFNQPLTFNETTEDYFPLKRFNFALTAQAGVLVKDKIDIYIYGSSPTQYNNANSEDFSVKSGVLAFCLAYAF
jgi:hypothetical protein